MKKKPSSSADPASLSGGRPPWHPAASTGVPASPEPFASPGGVDLHSNRRKFEWSPESFASLSGRRSPWNPVASTGVPASPEPFASPAGVDCHSNRRKLVFEWSPESFASLSGRRSPWKPVASTGVPASPEPFASPGGVDLHSNRRKLLFESSPESPAKQEPYQSPPETPDSDGCVVLDTLSPWSLGEYAVPLDDDVDTAGWTPVPETEMQPSPAKPPPVKKMTRWQTLKQMFPYSVRMFLLVCLI